MKRIILTYGVAAGAVIIGSMILSMRLSGNHGGAVWLGYLVMIVAFGVIFLGVKRYRDHELGGVIRFKTAAAIGVGITLVASVVYVAAWEINLSATDYTFAQEYSQSIIADKRENGLTGAALQAEVDRMKEFEAQYAKPMYRLPMTFLEIFPVGLLVSLAAAGVLRRSDFLPAER